LTAILLLPAMFRLLITFVAGLIAWAVGALSTRIGGSHVGCAVLPVVIRGPDEYRQAVPVIRCWPQPSTLDEIPTLTTSLVPVTG
jgi:hypothetical protein